MKPWLLFSIAAALLVSGCAATPLILGPATGASEATCDTGCREAWERAQLWVVHHSKWKIQTATDVLIETFNPTQYDPSYGFTATKEPLGGGRSRISLGMSCGNPFGCNPRAADVSMAFNYYVATGNDVLNGVSYGSAIR
jgi:hypothetical protein